MKFLFVPIIAAMLFLSSCNAQQDAQRVSNIISGLLNIAQAEEPALPAADAAIMTPWVNLGFTLDGQLNTCIQGAGNTKAKLAGCFTAFASGLLSPAELTQLRLLNPNTRSKVQLYATAVIIAVNGALVAWNSAQQPQPTIATPPTAADLGSLKAELVAQGYAIQWN